MKKILRKIIKYSRVGIIRRYFKYHKYTKLLNIKGGFVTDIHEIELRDGKLYSLGADPNISIKLFQPTNKLKIAFKINMNNNLVQLFYIPMSVKKAGFRPEWYKNIGICDNTFHEDMIILPLTTRNIRIDLCEDSGLIDIDNISIYNYGQKADKKEITDLLLDTIKVEKNNKKIVIVTHALNKTGAPLLAYNIAKKLKNRKCDVVVISISDGYLESWYNEIGIPVINLRQSFAFDKIDDIENFDYIVKKLYEKGFDNVITNTIISGLTVPTFYKYNYNIVSLIHEMKYTIENYNMIPGGNNINMYSNKIVFPDEIVRNDFYSVFSETNAYTDIFPQGLYKDKEDITLDKNKVYKKYDIPEGSKIIIGSGTADFRKGIDLFLQAAQNLIELEEKENYHFIWVGKILDDNLKIWYDCQFYKGKIDSRFHNIEFITDKEEYQNLVSCSDAFWLTSREDPFPSVMIESLEYGTPVLAFRDSGGSNTLLGNGRGTIIDNFDTKELALKTHELLQNNLEIENQIKKSQKYIKENLNFDKYIDYLEKSFEEENKVKYEDVSVIIPNYNYEDYLPIRLNSIINQTIKPKEIIFLDDVSSDNSVTIAKDILENAKKKYKIDYKIIQNKENNGCFRQWLKGIELASYDYIWIAEADDYARPNFIETLMPAFKNKGVVLSYCQSKIINEFGKVVNYKYTNYTDDLDVNKWQHDFIEEGDKQIREYFSRKNIIPNASSVIIKKSATKGLKDVLSKYNTIGDWLAYIYILNNGKVFYSSKTLNGHRRHSNSIIARKEKSVNFISEIIDIKKFILDNVSLNDNEINNLLLSIEGFEYYCSLINENNYVSEKFNDLLTTAEDKRKKKNILIIIPDLNVGGGQTVAIRIANSITKYFNVFLVNAQQSLKTDIMENMISHDVKLLTYNSIEELKSYNSLLKFESVVSFIWWSDKLAYQAFKDENVKLIVSMHGCYEMLLHNPDVDAFFNEHYVDLLNRADNIIYTAEKNKEVLIKTNLVNDKKVFKIDNGFLLGDYPKKSRKELGIKEDDFVFGLVARAIPEKGYEEAIISLNNINKKNSRKAHLILVGASDYTKKLKEKYQNEYIHFIDQFNLPLEWLGWEELFDVGLLPSYFKSESLPTVIVEYLFIGKPIIATDIAEIKSMIVNNEEQAGIPIGLKNGKANIKELEDAMNLLMNDKKIYDEMKKNTSKLANRFNMEICIQNYKNIIEGDINE